MNEDKIQALKNRKELYWGIGFLWLVGICPIGCGALFVWSLHAGWPQEVSSLGIHPIFGGFLMGTLLLTPMIAGGLWLMGSINKADRMIRSLKDDVYAKPAI